MKKKGFTLIELLAVIVILAIIALITVPVVIKIINNAKKGAAEDSAYGVIESAKLFWASKQNDFGKTNNNITFRCDLEGNCKTSFDGVTEVSLDISGTKPKGGKVKLQNGNVEVVNLKFGEYYCNKGINEDKTSCTTEAPATVTITYNANYENNSEQISYEPDEAIGTLPVLQRTGYNFLGWFTEQEGGSEIASSTPATNTTYYAHWSIKNVTVTFNSNGGSNVDSVEVQEGSTLSSIPTSNKSGLMFKGWYTELDDGMKLTTSTLINDNVTYYAHFGSSSYTLGQIVYYDPVSDAMCSSGKFNLDNVKSGNSTCYKWRVISTGSALNNSSLNIQLDHNIANKIAWVSKADYADDTNWQSNKRSDKGPITALKALATATSTWKDSLLLNYTYDTSTSASNYGVLSCIDGSCTSNGGATQIVTGLKARMITGEEIAAITKTLPNVGSIAQNWTLANQDWYAFSRNNVIIATQDDGTGNIILSWLVENTKVNSSIVSGSSANEYGDDNNGYWTMSPSSYMNLKYFAYFIDYRGLANNNASVGNKDYGIRPVITVPKADLN